MKYTEEYLALMEKTVPHLMGFIRYMEVQSEESDRGAVLVTASMLDAVLTEILFARLAEGKATKKLLDGFNAPLGTFGAKIAAARATGVITDEWYRELELLRGIRNTFAHDVNAALGDVSIIDKCNELTLGLPERATDAASARTRYWMSATVILKNAIEALHEGKIQRIGCS